MSIVFLFLLLFVRDSRSLGTTTLAFLRPAARRAAKTAKNVPSSSTSATKTPLTLQAAIDDEEKPAGQHRTGMRTTFLTQSGCGGINDSNWRTGWKFVWMPHWLHVTSCLGFCSMMSQPVPNPYQDWNLTVGSGFGRPFLLRWFSPYIGPLVDSFGLRALIIPVKRMRGTNTGLVSKM